METDLSEVQRLGLAREAAAIAVSARDRGRRFRPAAARALSNVTQDADLRHLTENVSHALAYAVDQSTRQVRAATGSASINPDLLTAAERIQYEGSLATLLVADVLPNSS